ncbi:MAG: DUF6475 domain-containing protein [Gammaproteobacteria bacterium]|nr:DUF6475 domain-containing protein [Gammaproteobacteria bacterium]
MIDQDLEGFSQIMTGLGEIYRLSISVSMIEIYFRALRRYELAAVDDAIQRHLLNPDNGQFMPKPADIARMLDGGSKDTAALAWSRFDQALRHIGTYRDIRFDDPIIMRVVQDMGGWIAFGEKSEDEWPFVANDFKARYAGYRSRSAPFDYPALLRGRVNGENGSQGFTLEPPVDFGDPDRCRLVEQRGSDSAQDGDIRRALDGAAARLGIAGLSTPTAGSSPAVVQSPADNAQPPLLRVTVNPEPVHAE